MPFPPGVQRGIESNNWKTPSVKTAKAVLGKLKKKKKNGDQISAFTENGDLHKRSSYLKTKNNVFISLFL